MLPDRVSNPGFLTYESRALPIVLRGPATITNVVSGTMCIGRFGKSGGQRKNDLVSLPLNKFS